MTFQNLYPSVFGILRLDTTVAKDNARIAGSGFTIAGSPIRVLTCNHVVGEATEANDGRIRFSITKRSDRVDEFDLRSAEISFLGVKRIRRWPELDLALLEIDPSADPGVAAKLGIVSAPPVKLNLAKENREPGRDVQWLSTAGGGDLTLTPRMFKGHIVARYKTDNTYKFVASNGAEITQVMPGVDFIEVDKLFIPGVSGSPIVDAKSGEVIAYVHGFRSWPIPTASEITQSVELTEHGKARQVSLKSMLPLTTSLSLAVDVRAVEAVLRKEGVLK